MLCEKCGERQANVHISKNINGRKQEYHLCDECAKKSGEMGNMNRFFNSFFESVMPVRSRRMPSLLRDELLNPYAGCEDCIDDVKPKVLSPIDRIQKLREEMKIAVEKEDFERAAEIRDEIKRIESPQDGQ